MTSLDDAIRAQVLAADPEVSTWLSANAGSGKTRVLTDRVARLLLRGILPQNILCLTYTKAAAGEMQNRLFKTLGSWAMMADGPLGTALEAIGARAGVSLSDARTLFARAIETPGGLKIQTIHSFCAALLRQFPLEAGVSPGFVEMDQSAQHHLLSEIMETMAAEDPEGTVSTLARHHSGYEFGRLVAEIVNRRDAFALPATHAELLRRYGAPQTLSREALLSRLCWNPELFERLLSALKSGGVNDTKCRDLLSSVDPVGPKHDDLPILEHCFLTGEGATSPFRSKAGKFPTKAARGTMSPDDLTALEALMDRVEEIRPLRLALDAADRTLALHRFAARLLPAYEAEKARRGWLDFDDLISGATRLLKDTSSAAWILFKLDARIEQILVDESQDTSREQWRLIELISGEMGAGEGSRPAGRRSLFVVGDKKQSIYSFQGADALAFDAMHERFSERLGAEGGLASRELLHSFRSAAAILTVVDATFGVDAAPGLGGTPRHIPVNETRPGRVDLWPVVAPSDEADDLPWYSTLDRVSPNHPSSVLARTIAAEISRMVSDPSVSIVDDGMRRRIRPGDVLLLVRARTGQNDLFQSLIRACKTQGLPVAGADVMRLDEELAVRDLSALLAFVDLPEDSLSLAAVLRSPLFGWTEDALFDLASGRETPFLWRALQRRAPDFPETVRTLEDLRDSAEFLRPYDLLERALIRHDGRRRLVARLGPECEDAIDEMLRLALAYERQEVPSITGFLAWLEGEAKEVKRAVEASADAVRVMTIHGAKGLEAPIVFLPDTMRLKENDTTEVLRDQDGEAHWPGTKSSRPNFLTQTVEANRRRNALEQERLLYVAMTRARNWLIVCGVGKPEKSERTWHGSVEQGMRKESAVPFEAPVGSGLRIENGDWSAMPREERRTDRQPRHESLPEWATRPFVPAVDSDDTLSPSDLGGAKALPGEGRSEEEAKRLGRQIHLLLEHLPAHDAARHEEIASALLGFGEDATDAADAQALARSISPLLRRTDLSNIFGPDALAEVRVAARLPELGGRRIHGAIDRLLVEDPRVVAVDFKTNAVVPERPEDVPEGILRQMGAYCAALRQIYEGREIECAILWTTTGSLMPLENDIVMKALSRAATS